MWQTWGTWISELFINVSILITLIFVGSQFFMKGGISRYSSLQAKTVLGLMGGVYGIILMNFTIVIPPEDVFVDMRNVSIIMTSIYGGPVSTLITAIMLSIFRWIHGGMNYTSGVGVVSIIVISIITSIISKLDLNKEKKWLLMFVTAISITSISLFIILHDKKILASIIIINFITCIIAYSFVYILTKQLERNYHLIKGLKRESTHDYLTGLMNVRAFDKMFNETIEEVKRDKDGKLAILMIDIDHFKEVNDTYGHSVGDMVLSEVGGVILESVRSTDIVARIGGEEFCVILKKSSVPLTLDIAERIRMAIEGHKFSIDEKRTIRITISVGASIYPETIGEINKIKEASDRNLYQAKDEGRNRVILN